MPVDLLEGELGEVVETRLLEQRQRAEAAGQRLRLVGEVDQQRLAEAGLHKAVGVAVERRLQRLAGELVADVGDQRVALEVGDRARFRGGRVGRVADRKDVGRGGRLQRVRVDGDEAQL